MPQLIKATLELQNGQKLEHYLSLSLKQDLFQHHTFEIQVPFEVLEFESQNFFSKSHQKVCGQVIKVNFSAPFGGDTHYDFNFKGIITSITLKGQDLANIFILKGYSPTIVMEDVSRRMSFHDQSLEQIFHTVLQDYPSNVLKSSLNPKYSSSIPYAVQYDETNFQFLHRLAAEYGEWFYFNGAELQLGEPESSNSVDFQINGMQTFEMAISLEPSKFNVSEYDYTADQTYKSKSDGQTVDGLGMFADFALKESNNLFTGQTGHLSQTPVYSQQDLDSQVKSRKSMLTSNLVVFTGNGISPDITVGSVIKVSNSMPQKGGRTSGDSLGDYRITGITHNVDDKGNYSNQFTAVPNTAKIPPFNAHYKRPVGQAEVGIVADNQDPQQLGRVKVTFPWVAGDPQQSNWMRVGTFYSGGDDGKGALFIPEVNAQVMVGYEGNDPDRPYVITSMYAKKSGTRAAASNNSDKIIYTTAGNTIDFSDVSGNNTITITNSNNDSTSFVLSFANDGAVTITTNGTVDITAKKDVSISGQNINLTAQQKIIMQGGTEVDISAQTKLALSAAQFTADAQSSAEISASGSLKLSGAQAEMDGSATLTLKGAMVQIN